ncbi:hypothetical protein RY27_13620, partial [Litorilinea aerophila]
MAHHSQPTGQGLGQMQGHQPLDGQVRGHGGRLGEEEAKEPGSQADGHGALHRIPHDGGDGRLQAGSTPGIGAADPAATHLANVHAVKPADQQSHGNRTQQIADQSGGRCKQPDHG